MNVNGMAGDKPYTAHRTLALEINVSELKLTKKKPHWMEKLVELEKKRKMFSIGSIFHLEPEILTKSWILNKLLRKVFPHEKAVLAIKCHQLEYLLYKRFDFRVQIFPFSKTTLFLSCITSERKKSGRTGELKNRRIENDKYRKQLVLTRKKKSFFYSWGNWHEIFLGKNSSGTDG